MQGSSSVYVLGISCFYHEAAACLLKDGEICAAAAEERFSRVKHDASFPRNAIEYCLREAGVKIDRVDHVVFYEKPLVKFERILHTFIAIAPKNFRFFLGSMSTWLREKLWMKDLIRKNLGFDKEILFAGHHLSHAASAFFPSPFKESAIVTFDAIGEWTTTSWGHGADNSINLLYEIRYPHSIGLFYSAFTHFLGFQPNDSEYKVMAMAAYGKPRYVDVIKQNLIDVCEDGSFKLNLDWLPLHLGDLGLIEQRLSELFGIPRRASSSEIESRYFDLARSLQDVTEEVILNIANQAHKETKQTNLCMAGGVALNSVANGKILKHSPFKSVYIQPAAGDDGGAYGAAALVYYSMLGNKRVLPSRSVNVRETDVLKNAFLGPQYGMEEVRSLLDRLKVRYEERKTEELVREIASILAEGSVVGLFRGRMEWGPRALGNRSILADPRDPNMKDIVNKKIKDREEFRPFAPAVVEYRASDFFEIDRPSPYMLFVVSVREDKRKVIPAVTHVDGSARVQTVNREANPFFYDLIEAFDDITGVPVILNTSFNRKGEPIVCSPRDAFNCFEGSGLDFLVLENLMVRKEQGRDEV